MKRPYVMVNMAMSVDGKISTRQREKIKIGSDEDRKFMFVLRSRADAVLIGANTLRQEDPPLLIRDDKLARDYMSRTGRSQPINAVVIGSLDIHFGEMNFFNCRETERIVYTTDLNPINVGRARRFAEVVPCRTATGRVDLAEVLSHMSGNGIHVLLLEGGGILNFSMLERGFVDYLHITVCPLLIGGSHSPTIFDGGGFPQEKLQRLKLRSCRTGSTGEVFLEYSVQGTSIAS